MKGCNNWMGMTQLHALLAFHASCFTYYMSKSDCCLSCQMLFGAFLLQVNFMMCQNGQKLYQNCPPSCPEVVLAKSACRTVPKSCIHSWCGDHVPIWSYPGKFKLRTCIKGWLLHKWSGKNSIMISDHLWNFSPTYLSLSGLLQILFNHRANVCKFTSQCCCESWTARDPCFCPLCFVI